MIKTYKRPIYSYGILYKVSKNKYTFDLGSKDFIRLSFSYNLEDRPEGFVSYVDLDTPKKLIKKLKDFPYEPVIVKCVIDAGVKFELNDKGEYWSDLIGFLSEVMPSYRNFSDIIIFREKKYSNTKDFLKNAGIGAISFGKPPVQLPPLNNNLGL